jgi:hypothetical protein
VADAVREQVQQLECVSMLGGSLVTTTWRVLRSEGLSPMDVVSLFVWWFVCLLFVCLFVRSLILR